MASDIAGLRDAYVLARSLDTAFEYGPLYAYEQPEIAQALWQEIINPAVALVHQSSRKTPDGVYVANAPSPWHAYFYLRAQQNYLYRAGRPLGEVPVDDKNIPGEHMFFRGQQCSTWAFVSSLQRKGAASKDIERRAKIALSEYFGSTFARNQDVANNAGECFAQHYGIATDLIDISCDPDIAVWFATRSEGDPCPQDDSQGIVRAISWASQRGHADTSFLLAPPFVRNLYTQRGLFVDASGTGGQLTGKFALEIRFPRETAAGEFAVVRGGKIIDVWPRLDSDELELVQWARNIGATCSDEIQVRSTVRAQEAQGGLPKFWLARELVDFDVGEWLSILAWILPATCVTALPVDGPEPMRYEISLLKMKALVRSNPTFFRSLLHATEGADFSRTGPLEQVLGFAKDELENSAAQ
jgi:hypothetical protein